MFVDYEKAFGFGEDFNYIEEVSEMLNRLFLVRQRYNKRRYIMYLIIFVLQKDMGTTESSVGIR